MELYSYVQFLSCSSQQASLTVLPTKACGVPEQQTTLSAVTTIIS